MDHRRKRPELLVDTTNQPKTAAESLQSLLPNVASSAAQVTAVDAERLKAELRHLENFRYHRIERGVAPIVDLESPLESSDDDDDDDHRYGFDTEFDSTEGSPVEMKRDPEWIDVARIKSWVEACDRRHDDHCRTPHTDAVSPYWLIDAPAACIVRGSPSKAYVALSYVWGSTAGGQVRRDNLARLRQRGALLQDDMPQTIQDVIRLLPLLGERYLWVDRLCIIQDDEREKETQISNMASIYSNARMTLVVALGDDAGYGLRGFASIRRAPLARGKRHHLSWTEHQLTRLSHLPSTKWYSRGWTLQEIVFSRRTLFLTEEGAFWECHCHTWSEDTAGSFVRQVNTKCNKKLADIFRSQYFPPWPNLHMYLQLVAAYNNRELTFDDDVLAAFAGITSSLSSFEGGFLYGLPEIFLDVALLWRPLGPCRRRRTRREGHDQAGNPEYATAFPSWSWIGWQMDMDPLSWKCGYDYIKSTSIISWPGSKYNTVVRAGCSWQLRSTVQWHVADGLDSPTRPVVEDYKRYQRSGSLPEAWSRYSLPFEGPDKAEFIHPSDTRTRFHFPIPLQSDSKTKDCIRHGRDGPFLYCKTDRAYFMTEEPPPGSIVASLVDDEGKWVGVVRMQVDDKKFQTQGERKDPLELSTQPRESRNMQRREFIAVSEGSARNDWNEKGFFEEWDFEERPRNTPLYEFVNVLCVERKEEIFYRQGVGRVLKAAWVREKPTAIQVTLG